MQLTTVLFVAMFALMAVVHVVALELILYWRYFWFDIPMHALGGLVVALGFFTLIDLRLLPLTFRAHTLMMLSFVAVVALAWELFELSIGIPIEDDFFIDTSIDLVMGMGGGIIGLYIARRIHSV